VNQEKKIYLRKSFV